MESGVGMLQGGGVFMGEYGLKNLPWSTDSPGSVGLGARLERMVGVRQWAVTLVCTQLGCGIIIFVL